MSKSPNSENPINKRNIAFWSTIAISIVAIANLLIIVDGGPTLFGFVISLIFASVPILLMWLNEFYWRPISVEIVETGVVIHLRYGGKTLRIRWEDFHLLNVHPVDPRPFKNWHTIDGYLYVTEKRFFTLYWPLAIAVRDAYQRRLGHFPPNPSQQ